MLKIRSQLVLVEREHDFPVHANTLMRFNDNLRNGLRPLDLKRKEIRPTLIANKGEVSEPACGDKHRPGPRPSEQRVRGHRRANSHLINVINGDGVRSAEPERFPNAPDDGVVATAEHLRLSNLVAANGEHISKGPTAVDGDTPPMHALPVCLV